MKKSQVKFDSKALKKAMLNNLIPLQTARLVAYAKDTIQKIGNTIRMYHSVHNMDRTGNLLDSLCWGVSYNNELIDSGFYREQVASKPSFLHEWGAFRGTFAVYGHEEAQNYINKYGKTGSGNGYWRVFFAILAPYWGYWEEGFTLKSIHGEQFRRFAVMSQYYDKIGKDLKPAKPTFHVSESINYTQTWSWKDKKGKEHKVLGTLDKWNESGRYKQR